MAPTPLRSQLATQTLCRSIGASLNKLIASDLEPEFRHSYDEPSNWHREIFQLLPRAMRARRLMLRTKQAILGRVVLRDFEALTRFFVAIITSHESARFVKELHCHVDLGSYTSPHRLNRDMALMSGLSHHLDRCPISLELLIAMKDQLAAELGNQAYDPRLDMRFRQAMFLSLLGHLHRLDTLCITIHGQAYDTLSWLRSAIQSHFPGPFVDDEPCLYPCRSLRKLIFYAADSYKLATVWHPCCLWPLMNLPGIEALEVDHNPAIWQHLNTGTTHTEPNTNTTSSSNEVDISYRALGYLHALRLKYLSPLPETIRRLFSSFQMLHTLSICGSVISSDSEQLSTPAPDLSDLLSTRSLTTSLRYLSIDLDISTLSKAQERNNIAGTVFGPGGRLPQSCLDGLRNLKELLMPAFALLGPEGDDNEHIDKIPRLPSRLERLEIVQDPPQPTCSVSCRESKLMNFMRALARESEMWYPALKHVVVWVRDDTNTRWTGSEVDEAVRMFGRAGVVLEFEGYEAVADGRIGGWRVLPGEVEGE